MPDEYQPTLTDVAQLLAATASRAKVAESAPLFHWLLKRNRQQAASADGGLSPLELAELQVCLYTEAFARRTADNAVRLLAGSPETARLLERLEVLCRDPGLGDEWATEAPRAVQLNGEVDLLLASREWDMAAKLIDDANVLGEPLYDQWVSILEARLARGEGDKQRLVEVRDKLRVEAKMLQTSFSLLLQGDLEGFLRQDPEN